MLKFENIFNLNDMQLSNEIYDILYDVPSNVGIILINLLNTGKLNLYDLRIITHNLRNLVYEPIEPIMTVKDAIFTKLRDEPLEEYYSIEEFEAEKEMINTLLSYEKIDIEDEDIYKIFVDELDMKVHSLNYFNNKITFIDNGQLGFMNFNTKGLLKAKQKDVFTKLR